MRKTFIVAKHEFLATVKTKGFSLVLFGRNNNIFKPIRIVISRNSNLVDFNSCNCLFYSGLSLVRRLNGLRCSARKHCKRCTTGSYDIHDVGYLAAVTALHHR